MSQLNPNIGPKLEVRRFHLLRARDIRGPEALSIGPISGVSYRGVSQLIDELPITIVFVVNDLNDVHGSHTFLVMRSIVGNTKVALVNVEERVRTANPANSSSLSFTR